MYEDHTVGVVIPAYNEAGFVGDVIETVPTFVDRVYPVDDCSTDGTWEEIQATATAIDGAPPQVSADGGARRTGPSTNGADGPVADDSGTSTAVDADATDADTTDVSATVATDAEGASATATGDAEGTSATAAGDAAGAPARAATDADRFDCRIVPIRHGENRGVGGAIKTGYRRARADRIDVTVVMGGDGQMDPDWMADLIEPVVDGRAAYAKANRLLVPEHHETMPGHRFVGNHLLTVLTKIATGHWSVGDPQHGYTAISLDALETAGIDELYEYFGYCNDLLIRLSAANLRVADVPCPLTYADEESHIAYSSYVPRVSGMLLRSFLRRLWVDRDARGGRGRLALFLGGAIATVGGLVGAVTSAAGDADERATRAERDSGEGGGAIGSDGGDSGRSGTCRSALVAVAGVASLLGAMLLDAVMNSSHNYTERISADAEPRVGNPDADGSGTDETA